MWVFLVVNEGVHVTTLGPFCDEIAVLFVLEGTPEADHEGVFKGGEYIAFSEDFIH